MKVDMQNDIEHIETVYQDCLPQLTPEDINQGGAILKHMPPQYKTRGQKNKERVQRLTKHVWDPQTKKQKRAEQKQAAKARLHQIIDKMDQAEKRQYLDERKARKREAKERIRGAMGNGRPFLLDLVYEGRMNQKENTSLGKQVELIMRAIKQAESPPSIHLCSFGGKAEAQLTKMRYHNWAVTAHQDDVLAVAKTLGDYRLIYLSPDAEDELQTISPNDAFILGGLIDRTVLRDASLCRARELGVEARRLPITKWMKGRSCLNLDHVVAMVCKFCECGDWKTAFESAAPTRWKKSEETEAEKKEGTGGEFEGGNGKQEEQG